MQGLSSELFSSPVFASAAGFPSRNSDGDVFWCHVPNFLQNLATALKKRSQYGVSVFLGKWQDVLVFKSVYMKSNLALWP